MNRYFGKVGYRTTFEKEPGIWKDDIVEKPYYGDVQRNYVKNNYQEHTTTIKTPQCNNSISIVADPYAFSNFHNIVYATFMGTKWEVNNVDASQYPRLILSLGGVYSEDETDTTDGT